MSPAVRPNSSPLDLDDVEIEVEIFDAFSPPTTACRRVVPDANAAQIRRLQSLWKDRGEEFMGDASKRQRAATQAACASSPWTNPEVIEPVLGRSSWANPTVMKAILGASGLTGYDAAAKAAGFDYPGLLGLDRDVAGARAAGFDALGASRNSGAFDAIMVPPRR